MKIVFFGSDAFSIKALEACLHSGMELSRVVTTTPQKKGRGLKLEPSEISDYCKTKKLPVAEYSTLRDARVVQELVALRPDIFVVASYGKLIPGSLLEIPKYRLNVHPSLLPKYRGAAPIHWPILNGDTETGVSIIDIAEKLDAGCIYCQEKITIGPRTDAAQLASELARFSYGILKKVLLQVEAGKLRGVPQNEAEATLAPQLSKQDGEISLSTMTAEAIDRKVRGLQPWPGVHCFIKSERIALLETDLPGVTTAEKPGTLLAIEKEGGIQIATQSGILKILKVKPQGKKSMTAADFVRGRHFVMGVTL
ncbi:MAG: methionyl-tRNA formyltransferase [Candidatus Omnitrophota bacterium]|jgi:methionyl-tRNA formyltransferase